MIKRISTLTLLILSLVTLFSCSKKVVTSEPEVSVDYIYKIKKIKKVNNWYFIYMTRNGELYKVVSKMPENPSEFSEYPVIKRRRKYRLNLISWQDRAPVFNGAKMWPMGYSGSFVLDSMTMVRLEPEHSIWDLHSTPDLKGLYYVR